MRISDWSSDVCSSDLGDAANVAVGVGTEPGVDGSRRGVDSGHATARLAVDGREGAADVEARSRHLEVVDVTARIGPEPGQDAARRELQRSHPTARHSVHPTERATHEEALTVGFESGRASRRDRVCKYG